MSDETCRFCGGSRRHTCGVGTCPAPCRRRGGPCERCVLTNERLAALRLKHARSSLSPERCYCGEAWPCDSKQLLDEVERLQTLTDQAAERLAALRDDLKVRRDFNDSLIEKLRAR